MNYYNVLGVSKDATQDEIKKAYRRLAMKHHPDRQGGDASKLSEINAAYDVLKDKDKRRAHDAPHFSTNFNHAFTENMYRQQVIRNRNIVLKANVTLKDVVNGNPLLVSYRLYSGREDSLEINIPAGIKDGQILRFAGRGDDTYTGPRGDLLIEVNIAPDKLWSRQGQHLVLQCSVNAIDLILGTTVTVTTLSDKKIELKIPAGTNTGTRFNVKGHGMYMPEMRQYGNLYVQVVPEIPLITDQDTLAQLRKYQNETS